MKFTLLTASSRAAALPNFVAIANPDGKLKHTEMGMPNVSGAQNPRGGLSQAEGTTKNPLILHNNVLLTFVLIPTAGYCL